MIDHAFLAIDLSNDERHALSAALAEAGIGSPIPGRRPPPKNWHVTLRFLGECSDSEAERIMHRLSETVDTTPGKVWCSGLGAFPRASHAGVVFAAVDDPSGLLEYLAAVCEEAVVDVGFAPEERPFTPHLTISRLRPARDLRKLFDSFSEFRVPIAVRDITFLRTRRTPTGLTYEPIDSLPLEQTQTQGS